MATATEPISKERNEVSAGTLERIADIIANRVYSPRICLLGLAQVCEATGLSRSTILEMEKRGKFPRSMPNIGKKMWRESTLIAWMDRNDPNPKAKAG